MTADTLLTAFAQRRPEALAPLLEAYTLLEIGVLLTALPINAAIRVLANLPSTQLAGLLEALPGSQVATFLSEAAPHQSALFVAHIPAAKYSGLLEAAREDQKAVLRELFGVKGQTLAMQTNSHFVRVRSQQTCGEIRQELTSNQLPEDLLVIVVNDDSGYLGILPLMVVLADANSDRRAETLMRVLSPLQGDASVSASLSLSVWLEYPSMPVVDWRNTLIGVVKRNQLQRSVEDGARKHSENPLFQLIDLYFDLYADTFEFLLGHRR